MLLFAYEDYMKQIFMSINKLLLCDPQSPQCLLSGDSWNQISIKYLFLNNCFFFLFPFNLLLIINNFYQSLYLFLEKY